MPDTHSGLLDRHIAFLEALRAAGLPVSLAEDLDAVSVLRALDWSDRRVVKEGYAAAVVKRHQWRPTFDALFDLYFPRMVGEGSGGRLEEALPDEGDDRVSSPAARDNGAALQEFRERLEQALVDGDQEALDQLAVGPAGQHDDRGLLRRAVRAQGAQQPQPVHLGHVVVGDHEVGPAGQGGLQALLAVGGFEHLVDAELVQARAHERTHRQLVVDDDGSQA